MRHFHSADTWTIHLYHTDHLGAPQRLTDPQGQTQWSARTEAFGQTHITLDAINNPLRFPGQYHDLETGLNHNWNRDYNPNLGRYIQSDPIGLEGGVNVYGYVNMSPLRFFDEDGLEASRCKFGFGIGCIPPQPEEQDYSPCEYYKNVSQESGCNYHKAAYEICMGKNIRVEVVNSICNLSGSKELNCIRRCLVRRDAESRDSEICKTGPGECPGEGCVRKECIQNYHIECFIGCGISSYCFGGRVYSRYPNDGP